MSPDEVENFNDLFTEKGYSFIKICEDAHETRCRCSERVGSHCALLFVLAKVGYQTDKIYVLINRPDGRSNKPDAKFVHEILSCTCHDGLLFRHRYGTMLEKLERQFRSFPANIRRELLYWFITKHMHGYTPCIPNYNYDENEEVCRGNFPFEFFGASFCSNKILRAHHDYGEWAYSEGVKGCNCHGI